MTFSVLFIVLVALGAFACICYDHEEELIEFEDRIIDKIRIRIQSRKYAKNASKAKPVKLVVIKNESAPDRAA